MLIASLVNGRIERAVSVFDNGDFMRQMTIRQ